MFAAATGVFGLLTLLGRSGTVRPLLLPAVVVVEVLAIGVSIPVLLWGAGQDTRGGERAAGFAYVLTAGQIV